MSFANSPQQDFDQAVYVNYKTRTYDTSFKFVSREVFDEVIRKSNLLHKVDNVKANPNDVYRLYDEKAIFKSKYGNVIGESYCRTKESLLEHFGYGHGDFYSKNLYNYWINTSLIEIPLDTSMEIMDLNSGEN